MLGATRQRWDRFFPGYPLGHDPMSHALALVCSPHYGASEPVWGEQPIYPSTLERELQALTEGEALTFPATYPQRKRWVEAVSFRDIPPADLIATGTTWEVARVIVPGASLGQVERIATFVRAHPLDAALVPITPPGPIEFSDQPNIPSGSGSTLGPGLTIGSPCPWPFPHPILQVPDASLSVRFNVRVEDLSDWAYPTPFLVNGNPNRLPGEDLCPPWADGRNVWGSRYSSEKAYLVQGHVRVRLFVTVFAPPNTWQVKVGGALEGFWQLGGPCGEARRTASTR